MVVRMTEKESDLVKRPAEGNEPEEDQGDPSRLEIIRETPSIGPEGFRPPGESFISLGEEKDVLAMLRMAGLSEEAIAAFRRGEVIVGRTHRGLFGEMVVEPGSEDWLSKMKAEGRDHAKG